MDTIAGGSMLMNNDLKDPMEENRNVSDPAQAINRSSSTVEVNETVKDDNLNGNCDDTDEESYSAPFEILAEFLSALMARDYKNAFHYCKLILQYEPENITVQEFYPLIEQKIKIEAESCAASDDHSESSEEINSKKETDGSSEYYYSSASSEVESGTPSSDSCLTSDSEDNNDNEK